MKCDLHCHTSYSYDSTSPPKKMVEAAIKKGIGCLAITDHGEVKGAVEALQFAFGKPILIISGIEIKSKEGDILGLNTKKVIPNDLSAKETIKRIKGAGGTAIIPHPFGWFCSFTLFRKRKFLTGLNEDFKKIVDEVDGIEVLNASIFGKGNKIAFNFAKKFNLPFTAGSDAHFPGFVGKAYLEIPGYNLSVEEVLEKIKNREGEIGGSEASFFEKIVDHPKRSLAKLKNV